MMADSPTAGSAAVAAALTGALVRLDAAVDRLLAAGVSANGNSELRDELREAAIACDDAAFSGMPELADAYLTGQAVIQVGVVVNQFVDVAYLATAPADVAQPDDVLEDRLRRGLAHLRHIAAALATEDPKRIDAVLWNIGPCLHRHGEDSGACR